MPDEPTVLFLCTGNYYRSRLAELLFNHYAAEKGSRWRALSRGLADDSSLRGLSDAALRFLRAQGLDALCEAPRDPVRVKVDDIERVHLIVAMHRREHEPMLRERFGQIPAVLARSQKLEYWNVGDLPMPRGFLPTLLGAGPDLASQSEESATEHIHFAVLTLLDRLNRLQDIPRPVAEA